MSLVVTAPASPTPTAMPALAPAPENEPPIASASICGDARLDSDTLEGVVTVQAVDVGFNLLSALLPDLIVRIRRPDRDRDPAREAA